MDIVLYVFAAAFILMGAAVLFAYWRTRHYGLFLMGTTYITGAVVAILFTQWWPLLAAFAIVWLLRWMGLEPKMEPGSANESDAKSGQS